MEQTVIILAIGYWVFSWVYLRKDTIEYTVETMLEEDRISLLISMFFILLVDLTFFPLLLLTEDTKIDKYVKILVTIPIYPILGGCWIIYVIENRLKGK